jgi:glycosyltransferase involved in cell wall biosynthesis
MAVKIKQIPQLSVFFPAYNEEHNLKRTVEKALPTIRKWAAKYEIIIVNDGSQDKTGEIADALAKEYPFIRVIHHSQNRGYGAAIKSGFYNAKYPWIFYTDADGQFDITEIAKLVKKQRMTNADAVIGYYIKRQVPFYRIIGSKVLWELPVFLLCGLKVRDIDCGFKLLRQKIFATIPQLESERGPFISTEFLVKAKRAGFKIVEVPVHHYPRVAGKATGASLKVILSGFSDLIRLRQRLSYGEEDKT